MALSMGTNGVRGLVSDLGAKEANDLGFGFGIWSQAKGAKEEGRHRIALARDMRITSPMLFEAAAAGLMESGCDVLDIGLLPSPVAEWGAALHNCDGLVIVTASHNSAEWNALKFVDRDGVAISKERGEPITAFLGRPHAASLDWKKIGSRTIVPDIIDRYSRAVLSFLDLEKISSKRKWKVIFDPGNGTSTLIAPRIFLALGAELVVINGTLDGNFPGRPSEPTEKNVSALIERVKKEGADFGVACDGDADRVVFVDEKGRWLVGDKCFALHAQYAMMKLKRKGKAPNTRPVVVTTVATSKAVEDVVTPFGAKMHYVKVGAPYIAEAMLAENGASGGEEVGGIIWPDFSLAKDGILAAAITMEMIAEKPLSAWHDALPKYYNSKTKIACTPEQKAKIVELAKSIPIHAAEAKVNLIDGIRLDFHDGWVIIRASGTENYFRIFSEVKTPEGAVALMDKYADIVKKLLS